MKKRMKRRVKAKRGNVKNSGKNTEKRFNKAKFYDFVLKLIVVLFMASLAALIYSGEIRNIMTDLCLMAFLAAILVFTLGILHYSLKKRDYFISFLITALTITGVISYTFFLYLALFTAVLFYFIILRREFKG